MFKSLRSQLFLWFVGSLTILAIFFYVFVHELAWIHGTHVFFILFFALSIIGFLIIYRITRSLDYLAGRIRTITYKNLDERILDIESDNEIGLLAKTFNRLLDRLHQAFSREQQFIADVAHELKTPLSTLRNCIEVGLQKPRSAKEYQQILVGVLEDANNLSLTIKDILDLAWSETPHEQANWQRFNLSELLNDLVELAAKLALDKKITVKASIEEDVWIWGVEDKLAKAILNVIDNGIKYSGKNGKLIIDLESIHDKALISITDKGIGIKEQEWEKIFNRFYRGDQREKSFGSGLGLAITKSITYFHKGDIKVSSQPGDGSVFTISLPLDSA